VVPETIKFSYLPTIEDTGKNKNDYPNALQLK